MIPLRLGINCDREFEPFVVRIAAPGINEVSTNGHDAYLDASDSEALAYLFRNQRFSILGVAADQIAGDVLLVDPKRQVAHRLIRAGSIHNTLLVTEQCDQLCVMCSQPPKKLHVDLYDHFLQAVKLAPIGATIGISGGEPTLHKEKLLGFLSAAVTARSDLNFHILTNGQHFELADCETLRSISRNALWGVPIYSSEPHVHDQIVGKPGAFDRVHLGLGVLALSGSKIELRTVVMKQNASCMPDLADHISRHLPFATVWAIMQMERIGYGRLNWAKSFFDSGKHFEDVSEAIDTMVARQKLVALYNFPLCTVPESYQKYCVSSISDWKRKYLDCCSQCSLISKCGGFFEWYDEDTGYAEILPK